MKYNAAQIKKFTQDPEWHIIEDILHDYLDPLTNIETINLENDAATVKAEITVRKDMAKNLTLFLRGMGIYKEREADKEITTYK